MQLPIKYAFSQSFVEELQRGEIYATHLRDAILPGPPPGAWVYRLSKEGDGRMETVCVVILHEFANYPGSLNCIQMYGNGDSSANDIIHNAIRRAFDYLLYSDAPE